MREREVQGEDTESGGWNSEEETALQQPANRRQPAFQPAQPEQQQQEDVRHGREVRGLMEGEEELEGWQNPNIPQPDPEAGREPNTNGWSAIGRVGAWGAMLCEHRVLEEIPDQHKATFVWGVAHILQKLHAANTDLEIDQALEWFCFLPQALLRKPCRGGRAGRGQVARRFNTLSQGDWGGLVEIWERDREKLRRGREQVMERPRMSEEGRAAKLVQEVLSLIQDQGKISKGLQRVTSNGVASLANPDVLAQLQAKYPARRQPLPERVSRGQCVDSLRGLRNSLMKLEHGVSPGTGGLRAEYLTVLAELMEEEDMRLLEEFGMKYLGGQLPCWFYPVWLTVQTVPLYKTEERDTVRPVGVRNPLINTWNGEVVIQNKQELREYFEPQQICCTQAGAAVLVTSVRSLSEARRDFIVVKLDIKNAFNEIARRAIIQTLDSEPTLRHLAFFAAITLAAAGGLEFGGVKWGEAEEGGTQGAPEMAPWFCVAIHPMVRRLDGAVKAAGGLARFGMDDGYVVGPKEIVFREVQQFALEVREQCSLELEWSKTEVFSWDGVLPEGCPEGVTLAGEEVAGRFLPGFLLYGIPVGTPEYATTNLWKRAFKITADAKKTLQVLKGENQALWAALKWSISQRFDYFCQLSYPSDIRPVAEWLDGELWRFLEAAVGAHIPQREEGRGWECVLDVPVDWLMGKTFQCWVARQPVKLGGMGLRSLVEASQVAFVGAMEQAVPTFAGPEGLCPQLTQYLGGEECFGEAAAHTGEGRWRHLLEHGGRLGEELRATWDELRLEAGQAATWLEEELEDVLSVEAESIGGRSTNGGTRTKISEQREQMRGRMILKAVERYHDQEARPCWSWPDRGKQSSAWLLTLSGLSGPEFSEAAATLLCVPSPACASRLGERVTRRKTVDIWGDNVRSAALPGDGFRKRHDLVKNFLVRILKSAGISTECEVFNMFAREIPQAGLARIERGRVRQAIVPDFRISQIEPGGDREISRLWELKAISSCKTRYPRNPRPEGRAVDRRSDLLQGEYEKKARTTDQRYGGAIEGEIGRCEAKLLSYGRVRGLVVGGWGELNEDFKQLLEAISQSRHKLLENQAGSMTRKSDRQQLATIKSNTRQQLSRVCVQSQARLLLDRLEGLGGGGAGEAARRRARAGQVERGWERERRALAVARRQGRAIYRAGDFVLG